MDSPRLIVWSVVLLSIFIAIGRLFLRRTLRTAKLKRWWLLITDRFHEHQSLRVPELYEDINQEEEEEEQKDKNDLYRRVCLYLHSLKSLEDSDLTNLVSSPSKPTDISLSLSPEQPISDLFLGARLQWTHHLPSSGVGGRSFVLRIRKRDKRRILRPYLQHIHTVSEEQIETRKRREHSPRLFTIASTSSGSSSFSMTWSHRPVPFTHPATMETVVLDAEVKAKVRSDLESFLKSRQYYNRQLGRAWRRSYLLYGPSGTGKSSFAAAMAKLLNYDVYELDLSKVSSSSSCVSSDLKSLLLQTSPRSLILLEDFDRFIHSSSNSNSNSSDPCDSDSVSISGVLNFMDGVVTSCCEERVLVFTMTTKDNIDPILLRPGRVDVHIRFPMCDFNGFKSLAGTHLGVRDHKLFPQVEEIMFSTGGGSAALSPAEVGELMAVNRNSPTRAIKSVITALQTTTATDDGSGSGRGKKKGPTTPRVAAGDSAAESTGVKEIRKFYGLLRRKSSSRSESLDLEH